MPDEQSDRGSRRRQPQRVPPPITWSGSALDAGSVLEESPDAIGLVLWKTVRAVRLWAELPEAERASAFDRDAWKSRLQIVKATVTDPALRARLEGAAGVLRGSPVRAAAVAAACRGLSEWADEQGKIGTALEFMQAAALAAPANADLALAVARIARRGADYPRAESWYRQAISTARQTRNSAAFARAYLGLGITHAQRGRYPAARTAYLRSLRAARRHAHHDVVAMVYHELAGIGIRHSNAADVRRYAAAALRAYGPGNPRLPALAHDVAVFWMKRGYFREALRVFQAIPDDFGGPMEQLMLRVNRVRAAGALGDRETYERAWAEAAALLERADTAQRSADAWVSLTRGAHSMADWQRAEEAGARARELAGSRGEFEQLAEAEALLEAVRGERGVGTSRERVDAPEAPDTLLATELAEAVAGS